MKIAHAARGAQHIASAVLGGLLAVSFVVLAATTWNYYPPPNQTYDKTTAKLGLATGSGDTISLNTADTALPGISGTFSGHTSATTATMLQLKGPTPSTVDGVLIECSNGTNACLHLMNNAGTFDRAVVDSAGGFISFATGQGFNTAGGGTNPQATVNGLAGGVQVNVNVTCIGNCNAVHFGSPFSTAQCLDIPTFSGTASATAINIVAGVTGFLPVNMGGTIWVVDNGTAKIGSWTWTNGTSQIDFYAGAPGTAFAGSGTTGTLQHLTVCGEAAF